jgi:hypothetical protein
MVKVMKIGPLRWLGHLFRIQEQNPCWDLTLHKPEGTGRVGRPAVRWLHSVEGHVKIMGFRNWRQKSQDGDQGRSIIKEAKVHNGL